MSDKSRRIGADQVAPCDLCGVLVNVNDLVLCDVQGLRGFYVCSTHSWEREVRFKPSFLDRGGIGQVPDMTQEPLPASGSDGGWVGISGGIGFTMIQLLAVSPAGTSYAETTVDFANLANSDMTIEAMIYTSFPSASLLNIVNHNTAGNQGWRLTVDPNPGAHNLELFRTGSSASSAVGVVSADVLHRVSVTRNGTTGDVQFYVDGEAVTMTDPTTNTNVLVTDHPLGVGATSVTSGASIENIADVRVFNAIRTADEIADNWDRQLLPPYPTSLVGYWPMNEGTGSLLGDVIGGRDMTLVNGTWAEQSRAGAGF